MVDRFRDTLRRWPFWVGTLWLARFATLGHIPPWQKPIWADWFDQHRYFASATAFAHGNLAASEHWYPLGYSVLAAPFVYLLPTDPFLLLDLALFLLTCRAFIAVTRRFDFPDWLAAAIFVGTTIVQTGLAGAWAQPWTTTLSAALIWSLIERTLAIGDLPPRIDGRQLLVYGLLVGSLPLVRPVDGLLSVTFLSAACYSLYRTRKLTLPHLLLVSAGVAAICLPYALLHLAIYGLHATPYMVAAAETGFILRDIGWKAYILLIDPHAWYPDPYSEGILYALPWIVVGFCGMLSCLVHGSRGQRQTAWLLLVCSMPSSALMLTYADLEPPGMWYFGNIHYFKWIMPIFGCGTILFVRFLRARRSRGTVIAAAGLAAVLLSIRVDPVPVSGQTPARMLLFAGRSGREWQETYFSAVTVVDASGLMKNVGDFHQVADRTGVRAIAISRLFGVDPRRTDPGERPPVANQRPYARYAERVSFIR